MPAEPVYKTVHAPLSVALAVATPTLSPSLVGLKVVLCDVAHVRTIAHGGSRTDVGELSMRTALRVGRVS